MRVWVVFLIWFFQGCGRIGQLFAAFSCWRIFKVHTVPASLSPLSERTRRSIHHPRIWGGGEGEGTGGGCPESFVFMLHLTLHSTFHLKVSIVSQSRLDPGLLASERPLCPILHSENKVSPFVHLLSWKGCWDLVSCVCERVLVCIWVCVSKTPVHTNVKQWIVAPLQTPLLIKVLKKR